MVHDYKLQREHELSVLNWRDETARAVTFKDWLRSYRYE